MPHDEDPHAVAEQARLEISELEHIERKVVLGLSRGYHSEHPLTEDDLVDVPSRAFYRSMQTLRKTGPADPEIAPIIMREQMVRDGVADYWGPVELVAPVTHGEFHAAVHRVRQESLVRRTDARLRQALAIVRGEGRDIPPEALQEKVTSLLAHAFDGAGRDRPVTDDEALAALRDKLQEGRDDEGVVLSGHQELDAITGGAWPGQLIILAAPTACGKSALALQWITSIINGYGPVALISLEMTSEEIARRMVQQMRVRKGDITPAHVERARQIQRKGPLYIWDRDNSLQRLAARIGNLKMRHPDLNAVFVDYLGLVRDRSFGAGKTYHEISSVVRALKDLAMEHKIPIVALHQVNRDKKNRANKRPILSDLRDSGVIEEAANQVLLLYREGYEEQRREPGPGDITIAKNRSGPVGRVNLWFEPDFVSYYPRTERWDEPGPAPAPVSASVWQQEQLELDDQEVPL